MNGRSRRTRTCLYVLIRHARSTRLADSDGDAPETRTLLLLDVSQRLSTRERERHVWLRSGESNPCPSAYETGSVTATAPRNDVLVGPLGFEPRDVARFELAAFADLARGRLEVPERIELSSPDYE